MVAPAPDPDAQTYAIIGAAMAVHRQLGHGFLEAVYREALAIELALQRIPCQLEVDFPIVYQGRKLKSAYRADMVCHSRIVVELKALQRLSGTEEAQIINYLKASGLRTGLLLNFGGASLEYRRFLFDRIPIHQSVKSV